jgi:hypothetical protein
VLSLSIGTGPAYADPGHYRTADQIRADLNFPEALRSKPLPTGKVKIGIMDTGFTGLEEWLAANPEEAAKTHIFGGLNAAQAVMETRHGFDAYRVIREMAPNAEIHIYRLYNMQMVPAGIETLSEKGVSIISLSVGWVYLYPQMHPDWDKRFDLWAKTANDHEVFVVMAAGNHGKETHSFAFLDLDADGVADIKMGDTHVSSVPVFDPNEQASVTVFSEWLQNGSPPYEVVLIDGNEKVISQTKSESDGVAKLSLPSDSSKYWIQIHSTDLPMGAPMVLWVDNAPGASQFYNGEDSVPYQNRFVSPFFLVAGAYWTMDGDMRSMPNSSFGEDMYGERLPHVLGPGAMQLQDGSKLSGTSVAAPVLASLYAPLSRSYNLKQVVEATSGFSRLKDNDTNEDRTRFGVPDFSRLLPGGAARMFGTPSVSNFRAQTIEDGTVVAFDLNQCCMEGMSVSAIMVAVTQAGGGAWGQALGTDNKPVIVRGPWEKPSAGRAKGLSLGGLFETGSLSPGEYSVQTFLHYKAWPANTVQVGEIGNVVFTVE